MKTKKAETPDSLGRFYSDLQNRLAIKPGQKFIFMNVFDGRGLRRFDLDENGNIAPSLKGNNPNKNLCQSQR